jgi:uncharacterized protein YecE (DUF72 family)
MPATIRIGTCSWADEALSEWFYPPRLPAKERLAWYAEHFDTVEVDSTFYRLPSESTVAGWADRTPAGFTMHVKAFGLMTRHPVKAEAIPPDLRDEMPLDERGRVDRPPRELRGEIFARFLAALEPLRRAGKLGGILFQLPPYVVHKDWSLEYLEWAREQLSPDEMLVEFRHRSWLDDEHRAATLAFLERIGAGYVVVDAPTLPATSSRPSSRRPRPRPTSAFMAATSRPGTNAAARPPSASTTCTPTTSSASGSSRCVSSRGRPSKRSPSSTTTRRRRIRTTLWDASRRLRRTRGSCAGCST